MHIIERILGKHHAATLRVLRALLLAKGPVTKYWVEKNSGVDDVNAILQRLIECGVVKVLSEYTPHRYEIDRNNPLVKELEVFLARIGYLHERMW